MPQIKNEPKIALRFVSSDNGKATFADADGLAVLVVSVDSLPDPTAPSAEELSVVTMPKA